MSDRVPSKFKLCYKLFFVHKYSLASPDSFTLTSFTFTRITSAFQIRGIVSASFGRYALFKIPDTEYFNWFRIFSSLLLAFVVNSQNIWVLLINFAFNCMVNIRQVSCPFRLSETSSRLYRILQV